MRNICLFILACACAMASAQSNKKARMAAVYVPGYYINAKNDTIRGQVQINPEDPTDFYRQFAFISGRKKKPKLVLAGQTKAYSFEGRNFVSVNDDGQKLFVERLTHGRLCFYEYQYNGKINGLPGIESDYFISDTHGQEGKTEQDTPEKLSHKFYKRSLRPYLQDQPMIWSDLDKYDFNRDKVIQAINDFNGFYASTGK